MQLEIDLPRFSTDRA